MKSARHNASSVSCRQSGCGALELLQIARGEVSFLEEGNADQCAHIARLVIDGNRDSGAGVTLPLSVPRGTEVEIVPWNLPGAANLKARVVHISRLESVWLAGCQLIDRLTDDQLATWLATATAGP